MFYQKCALKWIFPAIVLIILSGTASTLKAQLQSVKIRADKPGLCQGDTLGFQLDITVTGNHLLRVVWSPGYYISDTTSSFPRVYPDKTTTYYVNVYDDKFGMVKHDSIVVVVIPKPVVVLGENYSTCVNTPVNLVPRIFDSSVTALWKHNGKGNLFQESGKLNATYFPEENELGPVTFSLTGYASSYCKEVTDSIIVTYDGTTNTKILSLFDTVCSNEFLELQATAENYQQISWSSRSGRGVFSNPSALSTRYTPDPGDNGIVDIIFSSTNNGCTERDTISIFVSRIFVEKMDDVALCKGNTVSLSVTSSPGYTYLWDNGVTRNFLNFVAQSTRYFSVMVTNREGCIVRDTLLVEVYDLPETEVKLIPEDQLLEVIPPGFTRYEFIGEDNSILQSGVSNIFDYSDYTETYDSIIVITYNEFGCSNAHDPGYAALPKLLIKVNAFSPNGDGINDILLPGHKILVMNRSGTVVYEGYEGWDGRMNGKNLPMGTYFYIVFDSGGEIFYKGPVSLLR